MKKKFYFVILIYAFTLSAANLSTKLKVTPTHLGSTTVSYNGNLGGIIGANQKCQVDFPGSHMCTTSELMRSGTNITGSNRWLFCDSAMQQSAGVTHGGCDSFTSNSSSQYGTVISSGDGLTAGACDFGKMIACCK